MLPLLSLTVFLWRRAVPCDLIIRGVFACCAVTLLCDCLVTQSEVIGHAVIGELTPSSGSLQVRLQTQQQLLVKSLFNRGGLIEVCAASRSHVCTLGANQCNQCNHSASATEERIDLASVHPDRRVSPFWLCFASNLLKALVTASSERPLQIFCTRRKTSPRLLYASNQTHRADVGSPPAVGGDLYLSG